MYSHPLLNPAEEGELHLRNHRAFSPPGAWPALISLTCLPFPPASHSIIVHSAVVFVVPSEDEAIQELAVITAIY